MLLMLLDTYFVIVNWATPYSYDVHYILIFIRLSLPTGLIVISFNITSIYLSKALKNCLFMLHILLKFY